MERLLRTAMLVWLTRLAALGLLTLALYYRWRTKRERAMAWLCACMMVCLAFNTPLLMLAVAKPQDLEGIALAGRPGSLLMCCVLLTLVLARCDARTPWGLGPLQTGAAIGLAASGIQIAFDQRGTEPFAFLVPAQLVVFSGISFGLLVVWCVLGLTIVPGWLRLSGAGAALGAIVLLLVTGPGVTDSAWRTGAWLGVDTLCCGILAYMGMRLLILTHTEHSAYVGEVAARALAAESALRADQEMLHELRSTVAGIASASRMLRREDGDLDPAQAARLDEGVYEEIHRIERRLGAGTRISERLVDLATVIRPVIECKRADGLVIDWEPERLAVYAQPDHLAEAVHVVLSNAQRHAAGSRVLITTGRDRSGMVELHLRDSGPGVAPDVRGRLFARGARSRTSPGEGIGLHVAARLLADHGGSLVLAQTGDGGGAEFVIRLPSQDPSGRRVITSLRS